ncbi:hypothetical protein SAMD00023353_2900400 [Rosellinia necatrix]|uniref:DUF6536 domain-containing protein n=1 Tax=Rosellinia necatrix TaxID=77044 RepID=A0A1W2TJG9_ROSNE|nr:hypothetical protein SAMD00023353_2900400 [Rosellinia necatrix]
MSIFRVFSSKGWRRTGAINVVLAYVCEIILLVILSISLSQPGASLARPTIIFEGNCDLSSKLNFVLHLLVNIISGVVLASSNFFMQVLSSPSREEIDKAHSWLRSIDIGIPSIKNLSYVTKFKSRSWFVFLVSSVPIHLFFNSAVFRTTYAGSEWRLTLATEAFTKGAVFFPPGASLTPSGSSYPGVLSLWNETLGRYEVPGLYDDDKVLDGLPISLYGEYGEFVPWKDYGNMVSTDYETTKFVANNAHSWAFLDPKECQAEYTSFGPRTTYGDVVVIVDNNGSVGWLRSHVFDIDPGSYFASIWDPVVPPDEVNSLWFSGPCIMRGGLGDSIALNTCHGALGQSSANDRVDLPPPIQEPWLVDFVRSNNVSVSVRGVTYNRTYETLRISHCLARQISPDCEIGISNTLLLVVAICVLLKALQGTVVVWRLSRESLVTPGDAIQSFILNPDPYTKGLGTLDAIDSHRLESGSRQRWTPDVKSHLTTSVQPRRWEKKMRRLFSVLDSGFWVRTYTIFIGGIGLLSASVAIAWEATGGTNTRKPVSLDVSEGTFVIPDPGVSSYLGVLLLANAPQLIFSFCYFSYNAFFTRLEVEREWNSLSQSYRPLRVSYPSGRQISSYRLQLPYRYSIPLIGISIGFHWLISNVLFLLVIEGGYYGTEGSRELHDSFRVSDSALVALGTSPGFLLTTLLLAIVLIILPPILISCQRLKGDMVAGATNSLVISAACHVTEAANTQQDVATDEDPHLDTPEHTNHANKQDAEAGAPMALNLAQKKLRWGVMPLTRDMDEFTSLEDGKVVWHMGFGGEEHDVVTPKEGEYYV